MYNVISSVLLKSIDVFFHLDSAEGRRRRFGKRMFELHKALDRIALGFDRILATVRKVYQFRAEGKEPISATLPDFIIPGGFCTDGTMTIRTRQLGPKLNEILSPARTVRNSDLLPLALREDIRFLSEAFVSLIGLVRAETFALEEAEGQPELLRILGIYDEKLVRAFVDAWSSEGVFTLELRALGLAEEMDGRVLRMVDAEFRLTHARPCVELRSSEARYFLDNANDVATFVQSTKRCRAEVLATRRAVKKFIRENCKLEDLF